MSHIIDRRKNSAGKSTDNRRKFIKRVEGQIKKALPDVIGGQSIKDITSGNGKVKVPIKGIKEPSFKHNYDTGNKKFIKPGNKEYSEGDRVTKPTGGDGDGGKKGSNDPSITEDAFIVELSREEFLKYFFEDLELPNLVKKDIESISDWVLKRAGYTVFGSPSRLNVKKTFKEAIGRQLGMTKSFKKRIADLEKLIASEQDLEKKKKLQEELAKTIKKMKAMPFIDNFDLRYNNFEKDPIPTTQAVMFCIMDVSGSMGMHEKDIAKRFFTLLYIFLTKSYEHVDIVFIRHHTAASEVSEDEFFNSRESGGTIVLPSLELMDDIVSSRYSDGKWNVYAAQASDGDTWSNSDAIECSRFLEGVLIPKCQYVSYIEIGNSEFSRGDSELLKAYKTINNPIFTTRQINELNEIWPVFRSLFEKDGITEE